MGRPSLAAVRTLICFEEFLTAPTVLPILELINIFFSMSKGLDEGKLIYVILVIRLISLSAGRECIFYFNRGCLAYVCFEMQRLHHKK